MPLIIGQTAGGVLIPVLVDANGVVSISGSVDLLAGTANIGDVDVLTLPALPIGTNEIGKVQARNYGWIGAAWQKNPLQFGFSGLVTEEVSDTAIPAGSSTHNTTAVPAGEIHVLTNISFRYVGTSPTRVTIGFWTGSVNRQLFLQLSPVSTQLYDRQGWWILNVGKNIRCGITGGTLNDGIYLYVTGFRIDVDQ